MRFHDELVSAEAARSDLREFLDDDPDVRDRWLAIHPHDGVTGKIDLAPRFDGPADAARYAEAKYDVDVCKTRLLDDPERLDSTGENDGQYSGSVYRLSVSLDVGE